jgi:NAD+ kinase
MPGGREIDRTYAVKVGVFANAGKATTLHTLGRLCTALEGHGIQPVFEQETAAFVGGRDGIGWAELAAEVDVVAVLGGDGTMLEAVIKLGAAEIPLAGVNTGRLGFLTSCTDDEVESLASALAEQRFAVSRRTMLDVEVRQPGRATHRITALNEVVLARGLTGRLVSLGASIDGALLNHYRADGLIVSTPTGSTAYSLSAGGPLISPTAAVLVITPICPHTLSHRSLVVDDHSVIELAPEEGLDVPMLFNVDGRDCLSLDPAARVVVRKSPRQLHLLRLEGHSFYEALRSKLNWRGG